MHSTSNQPNTPPPAAEQTVLQFEQVSHTYDGRAAVLTDVHFSLRHGESAALCGPNGSGKTTLLKLAAGLLTPSHGRVRLGGRELTAAGRKEAFRHIGFLFQDSEDQLFCPTVAADIAFGPRNLGWNEDEIKDRVRTALDLMQIAALADRPIHHLSMGEKKRVALAGLLAMRIPLLVLDEPTAGLDPANAKKLVALLQALNREHGYTLLIATHEIDRIPELARRVLILDGGRVVCDGPVTEILTDIPLLQRHALEAPLIAQYFYGRRPASTAGGKVPLTLAEALATEGAR